MRQAERGLLLDVGDGGSEARAVSGGLPDLRAGIRRDDHADLRDSGFDERLDSVEEHGFVGHRHELLGGGMGDRAQARPGSPREDQPLQVFHARERLPALRPTGLLVGF